MPVADEALLSATEPGQTLESLGDEFKALGAHYSGKVRENYTTGQGQRIIVVTDRVSAFDVVLGTIPFKGQVLNGLAHYWFEQTKDLMPNHLVDVPDPQVMRAVECASIPVEFVVRSYLTGSSSTSIWKAYDGGARSFCGHALPEGMSRHQKLPKTIVTPSTKAAKGEHDRSVSKDELFEMGAIEPELYGQLEAQVLELFERGRSLAQRRGLILVDTKYELGRAPDGTVVLIDEIHTPDSSRYWYAESYDEAMSKGENPKALDKEYVRRWLLEQGFSGDGTPPELPREVRAEAARRYIETYERITGSDFVPDTSPPQPRIRRALGLSD